MIYIVQFDENYGPASTGSHNKQQKIFHIQQSNMVRVEKFSFANRLNDIISLLSGSWLDETESSMKKNTKY